MLPYVLAYSRPRCNRRLAQLARLAGMPSEGRSDDELGAAFVARIRQLNAVLSIPRTVEAMREEGFDRIVDNAFAEAYGTYGVPRCLGRGEAHDLLTRLLPGQPQAIA